MRGGGPLQVTAVTIEPAIDGQDLNEIGMNNTVLEEEDTDVVDYEGEWYGGQEPTGTGTRSVVVLRIAADGTIVSDAAGQRGQGHGAAVESAQQSFGSEWSDAGRVGSTAKRRKWRV